MKGWNGQQIHSNFGKYANHRWCDLPDEYLTWKIENARETIEKAESELERREQLRLANMDDMEREIHLWFREKARKAHPDAGGTHEEFIRVNQIRDSWMALLNAHKLNR